MNQESFDVVFLDVIMPGTPSLFVLEEMNRLHPETKVIMITGRMLDRKFKKEFREKGAAGFVQKPFILSDILRFLS
jgi:DNA-binding NtrC family response regulator